MFDYPVTSYQGLGFTEDDVFYGEPPDPPVDDYDDVAGDQDVEDDDESWYEPENSGEEDIELSIDDF